jgi:hypothetical protein
MDGQTREGEQSGMSVSQAVRDGQAKRGRRPRTGKFESIDSTREKLGQPSDLALLQKTFDRMK